MTVVARGRTKALDAWARELLHITGTHNARQGARAPRFRKPFLGWCERWFARRETWDADDEAAYALGLLVLVSLYDRCRYGRDEGALEGITLELLARAPRPGSTVPVAYSGTWPPDLMVDVKAACAAWLRADPAGRGLAVGEAAAALWDRHADGCAGHGGWAGFVLLRSVFDGLGFDTSGEASVHGLQALMDRTKSGLSWAAAAVGWVDGFGRMLYQRPIHGTPSAMDVSPPPRTAAWLVACAHLDPGGGGRAGNPAHGMARPASEALMGCIRQSAMAWNASEVEAFLAGCNEAAAWRRNWKRITAPGSVTGARPGRRRAARALIEEARGVAGARSAALRLADTSAGKTESRQAASRRRS